MNVLNLIDTGGPGGAETVFLRLATGLNRDRFRSIAAVSRDGWLAQRLRESGLEPRIVPASGSFNIRYLSSLVRLIRHTGTDLVLAHLYGSAIYASLAGLLTGVPVVSVLHGQSDVNPRERFGSAKAAIVRAGSRRIVCVSENLREEIARRLQLRDSSCAVIPNGVDVAAFQPGRDRSIRAALSLPDDVLLIGAIGNVRAPKAYDVLLRAAAILVRRSVRAHFVIAGEVSGTVGRELLELRQRLDLESHTTFLGLRSDVALVLHNLDIFVLSSRTEGFSIACIEAMACGVPVVATRSGGPQHILDEHTGILVPPDRPEELADAVEQLAHDPTLRERLAVAGPTRVRERFSLDRMIAAYESLLTELCPRKRT
jgi:glycosyltransferase involved in cell wall biosynthesis